MKISLVLPDGETIEIGTEDTIINLLDQLKLPTEIIIARVNGNLVDLSTVLHHGDRCELLTFDTDEAKEVYWHSAAHVMAQAVVELFPGTKLGIGPSISDGFYYDFDKPEPFNEDDLKKIENKMQQIIQVDLPFVRYELKKEDATHYFRTRGERYKVELINELPDEKVSLYRQGDFHDLCRGPHLVSTGKIKAFKLLSLAGAYWRGDECNPMLQRIYGTAYLNKHDLETHLSRLEEAKRIDHRKLGVELECFSMHDEIGPGLVLWHPKGAMIRKIIEDFWYEEHLKRGYEIIYTPHIAKIDLWKSSGHLSHFRESMYGPLDAEGQQYILKPMNCPFHIQIYKSKIRSYRDLPIRYTELGTVYRYERSGVLHGLLRVRGFTQDDAHIFCTPEQLQDEIVGVLDLAKFMMHRFEYQEFEVELSVRDPVNKEKYLGDDEDWYRAEEVLTQSLTTQNINFHRADGEAKFYGPAIDIKLKDCLNRAWQGPTIQFDFNLPKRLGVTYIGVDGKEHYVVMIHRTVLGTMERFIGGLIEHYKGNFPLWLAPVQVIVMSVTAGQIPYTEHVVRDLKLAGIRTEYDTRNEKIGYKIREAELKKIPYMVIVGKKEMDNSIISVRKKGEGELGSFVLSEFIDKLKKELDK